MRTPSQFAGSNDNGMNPPKQFSVSYKANFTPRSSTKLNKFLSMLPQGSDDRSEMIQSKNDCKSDLLPTMSRLGVHNKSDDFIPGKQKEHDGED